MNLDTGGCRGLRRMWPPRTGLLAIAAGTALLTAACSGSSASSPRVASLGNGGGSSAGSGNSATAAPKGNPTQLLNKWAACMRSHGDPGQADPTVDSGKVIHITMPPGFPGGVFGQNGHGTGPGLACAAYLNAASTALAAGQPTRKAPSQAELVTYAECMRAHGIPDFPDPVGGSLQLDRGAPGSDLDPANPAFQKAANRCVEQTGVHVSGPGGPLPPGTVDSNVGTLAPVPGGNSGSGANG
jgi:hypothetical protein